MFCKIHNKNKIGAFPVFGFLKLIRLENAAITVLLHFTYAPCYS